MTDIIEQVEAAEAEVEENWRKGWGVDRELLAGFVPDLVDELKSARAENERLMENCRQWKKLFDEVTGISPDDVALLQKLADRD